MMGQVVSLKYALRVTINFIGFKGYFAEMLIYCLLSGQAFSKNMFKKFMVLDVNGLVTFCLLSFKAFKAKNLDFFQMFEFLITLVLV